MAYSCHSWESLWLAMLPRAWTPPGCDPGMAWSSYHTGKDLLSGLEVPPLTQTRVTRALEKEPLG